MVPASPFMKPSSPAGAYYGARGKPGFHSHGARHLDRRGDPAAAGNRRHRWLVQLHLSYLVFAPAALRLVLSRIPTGTLKNGVVALFFVHARSPRKSVNSFESPSLGLTSQGLAPL